MKPTIATLGSHSALQLLKGAKDEGFNTLLLTIKSRVRVYRRFKFIDKVIVLEDFSQIVEARIVEELKNLNSIIIPHGSFVEYVGLERVEALPLPIFGNKKIFKWEADQYKKSKLLREAGIPMPRVYENPEDIDRLVIVKFPGAKGGRGYFLASSPEEFRKELELRVKRGVLSSREARESFIQEYVVGVPMYFHYFYSPIKNEVELLGVDVRYESNVDGIVRLPPSFRSKYTTSFVVTGNIPVVIRESLLEKVFEYGEKFVEASKRLVPPGIIGPFCLETICTDSLDLVAFEFSARIVAGTNLYIQGSPYSYFYFDEPMSMGRRIAREIKWAIEINDVNKVLT